MNKFITIAALTIIFSSLAFGYGDLKQDNAGKIVGTWKSLNEINGAPQTVISITRAGNQFEGKFVMRGLTANGKDDASVELPIATASFDGNAFSFSVTFPEPEKMVTEWRLKPHSDDEAEFEIVKENGKPVENTVSFVMKRTNAK